MNKRDSGMRGSHMADFFLLGSDVIKLHHFRYSNGSNCFHLN